MANFAPGMLVKLISDGPVMTVERVYTANDGDARVSCQWFDKDNKLSKENFRPAALREYSPEDEGPVEPQF